MFCEFEESERMDDVYMCVNLDYWGKTEKKEKGEWAILDSVYTRAGIHPKFFKVEVERGVRWKVFDQGGGWIQGWRVESKMFFFFTIYYKLN